MTCSLVRLCSMGSSASDPDVMKKLGRLRDDVKVKRTDGRNARKSSRGGVRLPVKKCRSHSSDRVTELQCKLRHAEQRY